MERIYGDASELLLRFGPNVKLMQDLNGVYVEIPKAHSNEAAQRRAFLRDCAEDIILYAYKGAPMIVHDNPIIAEEDRRFYGTRHYHQDDARANGCMKIHYSGTVIAYVVVRPHKEFLVVPLRTKTSEKYKIQQLLINAAKDMFPSVRIGERVPR